MTNLNETERVWSRAVFGTMFPGDSGLGLPPITEIGFDAFIDEVLDVSPTHVGLGLRFAVFAIAMAPPFVLGRVATFVSLSVDEREALLEKLMTSRTYLVRQLVVALKGLGAMHYGGHPDVRKLLYAPASLPGAEESSQ